MPSTREIKLLRQFLGKDLIRRKLFLRNDTLAKAGICFLICRKKHSKRLYFLSGLIAALSVDIHMNGILIPIALLTVFLYRTGIRALLSKEGFNYIAEIVEWILEIEIAHILYYKCADETISG